ncbi:MAG: hypothetical protein HYT98_01475 [Candidatus Sungbacteria bacterium]|nr:hypothetical protein [Candidatus Sungbacteria bacterium]
MPLHTNPNPKTDEKLTNTSMDIGLAFMVALVIAAVLGISANQFLGGYNDLLEWLGSQDFKDTLFYPMLVFIVLDLLLIAFAVTVLYKYFNLYMTPVIAPPKPPEIHVVSPDSEVVANWERIRELANSSNPSDWNMSILRADAILDDMLQHKGYQGETMADRLKILDPATLPSLDRVWSAHRLRNTIAHDPTTEHTKEIIINALRAYQDALRELGVMN